MTRDDIIRMAREAEICDGPFDFQMVSIDDLRKFAVIAAAAGAAAEREAAELRCAKTPVLLGGHHEYTALKVQSMMMEAIRARDKK